MSSHFLSQEFQNVAQVCERQQYPPQGKLRRPLAAPKSSSLCLLWTCKASSELAHTDLGPVRDLPLPQEQKEARQDS